MGRVEGTKDVKIRRLPEAARSAAQPVFFPQSTRVMLCRRAVLAIAAALSWCALPLTAQDTVRVARATAQDTLGVAPVSLHGFLQVYYRSGDPLIKDGYRLRKADLKFSGDISPVLRWRIAFDAAKLLTLTKTISPDDSLALADAAVDQKSRMLQDAALTYLVNGRLQIDVGQQIIPLSYEGTIPSSKVETIERVLFISERSRAVGLGDVRDLGVSANGFVPWLEYHLGVFNEMGESAGTTDLNDQKAVIGRFAIKPPAIPGFHIGGSGGFEGGPPVQHRERAGSEIQYQTPLFTLRAETMSARDGLLHRFGWYGLGAVRPTARLQLTARFDSWDRDRTHETSAIDGLEHQVVGAASYAIDDGGARVVLNVVRQTFPNVTTVPSGTILLAAFQAVW
jgi:Phosphate-selective porin O and P